MPQGNWRLGLRIEIVENVDIRPTNTCVLDLYDHLPFCRAGRINIHQVHMTRSSAELS